MQLFIDILNETPAALRLAAEFLLTHAALREASEVPTGTPPTPFPLASSVTGPGTSTVNPTSAPVAAPPPAPPAPQVFPSAPSLPAVPTAVATPNIPDSAPTGNVLPFVPPAPSPTSAPSAAIPGTTVAPATPSPATASPGVSAAPPAAELYDSAGVPFDARIHQKKLGQKKDGTWKLQKGIADAIVSAVMQELTPRIRKSGLTPLTAGAPAPVSLPPPPPPPPAPHAHTGQAETVAPPAPVQIAAPPPPETVAPVFDPYRALVKKVTEARTAKRCTAEEVTACVAQAGVPSLQALNAMPHLISTVEAHIDALLATR